MGHLLGHRPAAARRAAGRRAERKAPGRKPPYGRVFETLFGRTLPGRPPVPLAADRFDGRPERGLARRREGVVPRPTTARPTPCWCSPATSMSPPRARKRSTISATSRPARPCTRPGLDRRRAPTVAATSCTTRSRRRGCSKVVERAARTARPTADLRRWSARSSAGARPRACTSVSSTATRSRTAQSPARCALEIAGLSSSSDVKKDVPRRAGRADVGRRTAALHRGGADESEDRSRAHQHARRTSCAASNGSAVSAARRTCSPPAKCSRAIRAATAARSR